MCPQRVVICTVLNYSETVGILEIQSTAYDRLNAPCLKSAFITLYIRKIISYIYGCCRNFIINN